jgi:hypothetical protein
MRVHVQSVNATDRQTGGVHLWRVVRAVAEASLLSVVFALAILLIGLPFALVARAVFEIISWMIGS